MDINIQDASAQEENDLYMDNECLSDMSMGADLHESHPYEPEMTFGQYTLQQSGPPGPPSGISLQLVFQPVAEELGTDWQDSEEDEFEVEGSNNVVTFEPDIEPSTPPVDQEYQMENSLLQTVEEARKLDQMRRIDDLGKSLLDSHL